ncbi:MAG: transposase [Armatimonadia bacterium]
MQMNRRHPRRLAPEVYAQADQIVFVTICTKGRAKTFADYEVAECLSELIRLQFGEYLIAFCVMPNHVHVVLATNPEIDVMTQVTRLKGRATHDLHALGVEGEIWERSCWDRHAREEDNVWEMVEYVLDNPVRWGLVEKTEEWPHAGYYGLPWARSGGAEL